MRKKHNWPLELIGIILALIWLSPFYIMIVNSFKTKREMFTDVLSLPEALNFDNYVEAFEQLDFLKTLFNSVVITVVSVGLIIIFSSIA